MKLEADALRRELNEWRDRAGLPRIEEPVRGEGFAMVLNGEIEVLAAVIDEEDGGEGYDGYDDSDEFTGGGAPMAADDSEDLRLSQNAAAQMLKNANANPFAHNLPSSAASNNGSNGMHLSHILPRPSQHGGPMIASNPSSVSFENPAMASLYEPNQGPFPTQYLQQTIVQPDAGDKWNSQLFNAALGGSQLQQLQAHRGLFTPPASALSSAPSSASTNASGNPFNDQEFFANFQRQQQMVAMHQQHHGNVGHMYGSPADGDDSSSVGSGSGRRRERSGSLNSGSGYGSPQHGSPMGNYEISTTGVEAQSDYGMPKRFNTGLQINTGVGGQWGGGRGDRVDGMNGMMKQNLNPPISVGGGGNGSGFAMMMM